MKKTIEWNGQQFTYDAYTMPSTTPPFYIEKELLPPRKTPLSEDEIIKLEVYNNGHLLNQWLRDEWMPILNLDMGTKDEWDLEYADRQFKRYKQTFDYQLDILSDMKKQVDKTLKECNKELWKKK